MLKETIAKRMYKRYEGRYAALSLSIAADIDNIKQVYVVEEIFINDVSRVALKPIRN